MTTASQRRGPAPVLVIVPSLVSGAGVVLILIAILVDQELVRPLFLCLGIVLLWLDFFITMAIFRHTVRTIDRRLADIERRLPRD